MDSSTPFADLTNTLSQGNNGTHGSTVEVLDPHERKKERDRERYASMSREKKDEINRKARERRMEKKRRDQENATFVQYGQGNNDTHGPSIEVLGPHERKKRRDRERYERKKDEINMKARERRMEKKCHDQENSSLVSLGEGTNKGTSSQAVPHNDHTLVQIAHNPDGHHGLNCFQADRDETHGEYINTEGHASDYDQGGNSPIHHSSQKTGVTQNYPHRDETSDACGAGTSGHASGNENCTHTQPSIVDEHESVPPRVLHRRYPREDGDDNIVFDEDEEADEGYLFAGQEDDNDDAIVDVDLARGDEEVMDTDAPDPFGAVYGNVPDEGHTLKPVDNCKFCDAKKFEYEPPGFCCRSGAIHLSTPDTPPEELVRLWTAKDADARHFS